ncbi:LysR family transcriptional regulator [Oryzibacter oryziterrae]|uniref:LysR family transcriptional regulator n=1 Tax=Oryzibacter oryziterrae TaxID=2766474 RepID=UPI001F1D249D|nr:LysR family transcriptional regulator [Oryzibacter oryziterrae]
MLDWSLLRSFLAVVDAGSLSVAAERLGSTQPTVGRHIRELEQALGFPLFRRQPRGLEPTPAALPLIDDARRMGDAAEALARKVAGQDERLTGPVRITASRMVALHLLPPVIAALRHDQPDIAIEIDATDVTQNLLRRDADIALRMVDPTQNQLVRRKITDIPLGIYAARSYIARRGAPAKLDDLLHHDVIGFDRQEDLIRGFAAMGHTVTRDWFPLRSDDHPLLWELLRAGAGIGFAQVPIADRDPEVLRLLPEVALPKMPLWLVMHEDLRHNRRIRHVADHLASGLLGRLG